MKWVCKDNYFIYGLIINIGIKFQKNIFNYFNKIINLRQ